LSRPSSGTRLSIFNAYTSNDVVSDKEVHFGGLTDENIFQENTPSPDFSEGILHGNRKVRVTFDRGLMNEQLQS
jgi:hypothetical protein